MCLWGLLGGVRGGGFGVGWRVLKPSFRLHFGHASQVEMLHYKYFFRVEMLRCKYFFRVEMLRHKSFFRVEMLRYKYFFQGGNAT